LKLSISDNVFDKRAPQASERRTPPALNTFKTTQLNDIWHYFIEIDIVD
jgi:hypothetical protein